MKREFLQGLTVGGESLPKEVIDAIMAENGKDIEAAKSSADAEKLRQELAQWQEKFAKAQEEHEGKLDALNMENQLREAIRSAGGRNFKAICALMDLDTLRQCSDRQKEIEQAVTQLKKENDYLFENQTPPPYVGVTGTQYTIPRTQPADLAGALREKFERK